MIYHRVLDEPDFMRPDEVDKEAFTWQMELLAMHFNVLPLSEALERMQNDTLPSRAVSITFDDGYADNYTNALPILKKCNLTATFFIANGFLDGGRMWNDTVIEAVRNIKVPILDLTEIGLGQFEVAEISQKCWVAEQIIQKIKHVPLDKRNQYTIYIAAQSHSLPSDLMMTSAQLIKLHQSGMEIGGHTVNHPILAKLDDHMAELEISENKAFLEQLINTKIKYFAYPNGKPGKDFYKQHLSIVENIGYQAALSTEWGVTNQMSDIWQLPRFTPWDKNPIKFILRIVGRYQYVGATN